MFLFKLKVQPDIAVSDILMMLVRGKLKNVSNGKIMIRKKKCNHFALV